MDTVLLTGAASGIGRAAAWRLAASGTRCVLVDRDAPALAALVAALPPGTAGAHLVRCADLTDAAQIAALARDLPPLDALLNNAGMTDSRALGLTAHAPADFQRLMDLNLHAPLRLFEALRGRLRAGARIVNVASGAGLRAIPWRSGYSPSKAGLIAQTRALARAHPQLRINVLCPGFVRTELVAGLIADGRLDPVRAVAKIPLGRLGEPDELACALAFLASAQAAPLTGAVMAVDGGSSIFGGSQAYAPGAVAPLPADTPTALALSELPDTLAHVLSAGAPAPAGYAACIDGSVCRSAAGARAEALLAAARRFDATGPCSLTLLLPPEPPTPDPAQAGEAAALRMLVSALACEWGPQARRINAVQLGPDTDPVALAPMLRFVAGAQAQYLTGQTLCPT